MLITIKEASETLGVSQLTLSRWIKKDYKQIPYYRVGNREYKFRGGYKSLPKKFNNSRNLKIVLPKHGLISWFKSVKKWERE